MRNIQAEHTLNGDQLEYDGLFKIKPMLTGTSLEIYRSGKRWEGLPDKIKLKLKIPKRNHPSSITATPDLDLVLCYNDDPKVAIHARCNLREVEKNIDWVNRMRSYMPTSHIKHIVLTLDKPPGKGPSFLSLKQIHNKPRDMASGYDAIYSMDEINIFESPHRWEDGEICDQIVRKFSHFEEDVIKPLINNKFDIQKLKEDLLSKNIEQIVTPLPSKIIRNAQKESQISFISKMSSLIDEIRLKNIITFQGIANELNRNSHKTRYGNIWYATTIKNLLEKIQISRSNSIV
jgi:hypothetical protein